MCFCAATSQTLAEQVDQSEYLMLAEWQGGEAATAESTGSSLFRIVEIARAKDDTYKVSDEIDFPRYLAGKEAARYILMGSGTDLIDWHVPDEASDSLWTYMSKIPPLVDDPSQTDQKTERIAFFLDYLEHPEIRIANDAYAEFAAAPYESVAPLADRMPREKLRMWVTDTETSVSRLGLYGLLLGLCGTEEDAEAMEEFILKEKSAFRMGIEGVMSGYLVISGEEGLRVLEDSKMRAETFVNDEGKEVKVPFSETYATMQTLRFMWTYEPDRIEKDRLKQSMRILLNRPELADLVITDLARWQDWSIQDQLLTMYDDDRFNVPSIKRAIVRYLYYCSEERLEDSEEVPEFARTAAEYLKQLEEKDPKTVRDAKRFLR